MFLQDFSDDLYDLPREFVICGSCVFHRSHVIASHLCTQDLLDIKLWLKCTSVADLTREHPVRKIVLWQELHAPDHAAKEYVQIWIFYALLRACVFLGCASFS